MDDFPDHGPAARAPEAGDTVLARYRLERRLGVGAFGTVWRAHDERLDRSVAVKVLPRDPGGEERTRREAQVAARLGHPGIVTLFEAGSDGRAAYLVSELVHGRTLALLYADGALSDRDVVRIGIALCDALAHAHAHAIVHRDVKPSNVIVPDDPSPGAGMVKLTDFGVAHMAGAKTLTRTGDIVGTLAYMAPEQAEGGRVGPSADVYSLALVLYEGLAGVNPVQAATPAEVVRRIAAAVPSLSRVRSDLPPLLADAIDAALEPVPEHRAGLQSLRAALDDVTHAVDDVPGTVEGPLEDDAATTRWLGRPQREPPGARGMPLDSDEQPTRWQRTRRREPGDAPRARPPARGERALARQPAPRDDAPAPASRPRDEAASSAAAAPWRLSPRPVAALATGLLAALVLGELLGRPPLPPLLGGLLAAGAAALAPRIGWLACALALVGVLAARERTGFALVLLAALGPVPVLIPTARAAWALPVAAPLAGAATLAGGFPAVPGLLRGAWTRAVVAAAGLWWLVLAEALTRRTLLFGRPAGVWVPRRWRDDPIAAVEHALVPIVRSGVLVTVLPWAVAAIVLPWIVRGRSLVRDLVAAVIWAAALAAATSAAGHAASGLPHAQARGGALGAAVAAALALALAQLCARRRTRYGHAGVQGRDE